MGMPDEPLAAPRSVKSRHRTCRTLPVVAICGTDVLAEDGDLSTLADLVHTLPMRTSTLFSAMGSADFVAGLDEIFRMYTPSTWQWRTSTFERDIVRPDGLRVASRETIVVHYFGWKGGNYHKIIDPTVMYGRSLDDVWPNEVDLVRSPLVKLLRWGVAVRDFCRDSGINVKPTIGGISSQFLTDARFYTKHRRKVPSKINQRAREELPGNHYELHTEPREREFTAHYLDQRRAHHYHARTVKLPASDTLYAYGRFVDLAEPIFTLDQVWPNFHGLYCLDLRRCQSPLPFSAFGKAAVIDKAFVWTNELQDLLDAGYEVTGVRAAWGSRHHDTGLRRYAEWAEKQLDHHNDPPWLKPLLLAAYGTLATKARAAEAVFRLARSGEDVTFRTGKKSLTGKLIRGKKLEPGITNVLHRGMIEAATRSDSIGLANYLSLSGHNVLSIYADAIMVECDDDHPLPPLPEPWRNKQTLNHLEFINQQAFVSGEMTKLPGVGREMLGRTLRSHAPRFYDVAEEMEYAEQ